MRGPEHVALTVVTTGGALWLMNGGQIDVSAPAVAAVSAAAVGSLVPDIDHPKAWISNRIPATLIALGLVILGGFKFTEWSVARGSGGMFASMYSSMLKMVRPLLGWAWLALAIGVVLLALSFIVAAYLEHRGPTHSLTVGAGLTVLATIGFALAGQPSIGLWFGWGYLSHLLGDMLTPMGCPALLWPWREGDLARSFRPAVPRSAPVPVAGSDSPGTPGTSDSGLGGQNPD